MKNINITAIAAGMAGGIVINGITANAGGGQLGEATNAIGKGLLGYLMTQQEGSFIKNAGYGLVFGAGYELMNAASESLLDFGTPNQRNSTNSSSGPIAVKNSTKMVRAKDMQSYMLL